MGNTGSLPVGRHDIVWNEGQNCLSFDFDGLGEKSDG